MIGEISCYDPGKNLAEMKKGTTRCIRNSFIFFVENIGIEPMTF